MGKLILITGGSRSGKSSLAVDLAVKRGGKVVFVATCVPKAKEMKDRVRRHRQHRPAQWLTVVEPLHPATALAMLSKGVKTVILDCLTLLISNLLLVGHSEEEIINQVVALLSASRKAGYQTIIVTNEVGSGLVPGSSLGRRFRDVAGRANQTAARKADQVLFMVSGIPMKIKSVKKRGAFA